MRLPFLLFLGGCFSLYFFLFLAFRSCLFLNARSSRLSSVTLARLSFMRIASSPLVPKSCMTWNKSMTISACGNSFLTMPIILSEKSIVTSLTFLRLFSGILSRCLATSATVVPLTAATSVPFLPRPSLLERKVKGRVAALSRQCSGVHPCFSPAASIGGHVVSAPSAQSRSGAPCRRGSDTCHQSGRSAPRIGPLLGRCPTIFFKKSANSTE